MSSATEPKKPSGSSCKITIPVKDGKDGDLSQPLAYKKICGEIKFLSY